MAGLGRGLDSLLSESKKNREEKVRENEVSQPQILFRKIFLLLKKIK